MSSSKCMYLLPKTQPTMASSSKNKLKTYEKKQNIQNETLPQVSAFMTSSKDQRYIHNMKIDYGKLQNPYNQIQVKVKKDRINILQNLQKKMQDLSNQNDISDQLNITLSTRKFKNLKQYTFSEQDPEQNQPSIHSLLTQKKEFSFQLINKANPESGLKSKRQKQINKNYQSGQKPRYLTVTKNKSYTGLKQTGQKYNDLGNNNNVHTNQKKKNRTISVKAYQISNKPEISNIQNKYQRQQRIQLQKFKNQYKMKSSRKAQDKIGSEKKISHSRIIKTFNPNAGLQTKIITYPDISEVIKIQESRNKLPSTL